MSRGMKSDPPVSNSFLDNIGSIIKLLIVVALPVIVYIAFSVSHQLR